VPVPEGVGSNPPGGLQDPLADGIIEPSGEEVVIVPLYGIVQDSPLITAGQKAFRRLKRNEVKAQGEVQAAMRVVAPLLSRIEEALAQSKEKKEEEKS